jgi:hypothetical protein
MADFFSFIEGSYIWNAPSNISTGIYFIVSTKDGIKTTQKAVLIR